MDSSPAPDDRAPSNTMVIQASPEEIFAVLAEPDTYPDWLVGAQHIREVDPAWPGVGSRFHHRIGFGPVSLPGSTSVRSFDEPTQLELGAGMGLLGEATVHIVVEAVPEGTRVTIQEEPRRGVVRLLWNVARPMVNLGLWGRNAISLSALAEAVERNRR